MMQIQAPTREVRSWTTDSRRGAAFKPRPGDIVIATAPKCGTTWMQQIVTLLVFQTAEPREIHNISPWIDMRAPPARNGDGYYRGADPSPLPQSAPAL
jgi:aryl sulfotransferase